MLKQFILQSIKETNIFETFVKNIANIKNKTIKELHQQNHTKGNIWEEFCVEYLKLKNYSNVMLLKNISETRLREMGLSSKDMGIDIIAEKNHKNIAVQCKFRTKKTVSWKEIATFEALVNRSGPFEEHIVMTNAHYIHREGKNTKDVNIVKSTFEKLQRHQWLSLCGIEGKALGGSEINRNAWLRRFG